MKKWIKFFLLFLILIGIDAATKFYVFHSIPKMSWRYPFYPFGGIGVFDNFFGISFSINLVENTGAAWGMFSSFPNVLFFIRFSIIIGLVIYLLIFNKERRREIPLLLIITGAIGNILDFVFYKKVIDMFHFMFWGYSYPVFNFADFFITIGIVWLFFTFFIKKINEKKNEN